MHRNLSDKEIKKLEQQGCSASEWGNLLISDGSSTGRIFNSHFSGECKIGRFSREAEVEKGIFKNTGIYNSYITNCRIGNDVFISNVSVLANYHIGDNAIIENVGTLAVEGETTFGNGIGIEVLNEGGGRELPIFDRLSAQIAYLMVVYRHDKPLVSKLRELIDEYVQGKKSGKGVLAGHSKIRNTVSIKNVNIGSHAVISGALSLEEGTVDSCCEDPAIIGEGVVAKKFIVLTGSVVDSGAMITSTFVGQGVRLGKQFSAEGSAFFANCEGFHGEACSIFAGPYTVTHHKSTLLIAGMFSFFNAGSGSNQSNHMYKLGPLHQGIVERGSKTGSFSYMLWPCRVGPYSVVMDKHPANFDAYDLPFSYITVENGKTVITPAMNMFTVGTKRDIEKWPKRDRRKSNYKLDLISFNFLNPFIVGKVLKAIEILREFSENTPREREYVHYKGANILRLMLKTTRKYYEMLVRIYMAQEVAGKIGGDNQFNSFRALMEYLIPPDTDGAGAWVDVTGLLCPKSALDELTSGIVTSEINSTGLLHDSFKKIFQKYSRFSWVWCVRLIEQRLGSPMDSLQKGQLMQIIEDGKTNMLKLNNMILKDAEKEFDPITKTGFGLDGNDKTRDDDFENVRGTFEGNSFVKAIKKENEKIIADYGNLINKISKLP